MNESFIGLDLGFTKPTSVPMEEISVIIDPQVLLEDFSKAFAAEAYRVNPLKAQQVELTAEEAFAYFKYLLLQRVKCVHLECKEWRRLKALYIPTFIQHCLTMVGKVILRDVGLTIMPVMLDDDYISFEEALNISSKVGSFENDLQIVLDGMPRPIDGDKDVMSSALIADYVRSLKPVEHVSSTYVAAFLGLKLREEVGFKALYRVQYDDLNFIASALITNKALY